MVVSLFRNSQKLVEKQQNSILSAATVITVAVLLSSILGFLRTRFLVSYFYSLYTDLPQGAALDAYMVSFQIPDFVFQLLVIGALSAAFIPVFTKYFQKDEADAYQLANSMINLILLVFLIMSVLIFTFAYQLNDLLTGVEFSADQLVLATRFTRIMLLAQFFFALSSFMTGILQAHHRFLLPALSPIAYNLGILLGIVVLGPHIGLYGAALGVVFGSLIHLLMQMPLVWKLGYRYQFTINLKHPGVWQMSKLMGPRVLALSVDRIELLIVTFLATTIPYNGSFVIVSLAQQMMRAPVRIFGVPIGQASLPFLSKESDQTDLTQFKKTLLSSLHQILYMSLPAGFLLLVLRIPLVRILFGARDFPWQSTLLTGRMVAIMSISVIAHASIQLLTRAFYALHDTKTPFISAMISLVLSSSVSWLLVVIYPMGVIGIAIGLTLGPIMQMLYLLIKLNNRLNGFDMGEALSPFLKMFFASALMGIFLWIPMRLFDQILDTTRTLNLVFLTISATAIGGMVYLWLSNLLEIREQQMIISILNKFGNWRKVFDSSSEKLEPPVDQI